MNVKVYNENNLNNNFWKWFGNSKVIKNGKPIPCYHGTDHKFTDFNIDNIGKNTGNHGHYGYGIYFSFVENEAILYGDNLYTCYLKIENPFTGTDEELIELQNNGIDNIDELSALSIDFNSFKESFRNDPNIYNFISDIEKHGLEKTWDGIRDSHNKDNLDLDKLNDIDNLIEYTTLNKNVHGVPDYVLDELDELNITPLINKGFQYSQSLHWITDLGNRSKEVTDVIKRLGYDGIIYGSELVVFDSTQIKSIHNNGTWNMDSTNIMESQSIKFLQFVNEFNKYDHVLVESIIKGYEVIYETNDNNINS